MGFIEKKSFLMIFMFGVFFNYHYTEILYYEIKHISHSFQIHEIAVYPYM